MTPKETLGKYAVGSKVWLNKNRNPNYQRVTITDNRVMLGNCYHGYTVQAYSESLSEHYTIGMVSESSLTCKRASA